MSLKKVVLIFWLGFGSCSTLPELEINKGLKNEISENKDFIVVASTEKITETMIFYPGGLVDPRSYIRWQDSLVSARPSMRIVTVKMPSNLAVLNAKKGKLAVEFYSDTEKWYFAGHSLGGAMAAPLIAEYPEKFPAIMYLAAYLANDQLKDFSGTILSISASNDGLTIREDIESNKTNLPTPYVMKDRFDFPSDIEKKTLYYEIQGGNHSQFGNYGLQKDDQKAAIASDAQQNEMVQLILALLDRI